jgi:prophage regulatory protein
VRRKLNMRRDSTAGTSSQPSVTEAQPGETPRLIRLPELQTLIPLSRTGIWRGVAAGALPRPIRLSKNVNAWRLDEVTAFIQEQTRKRDERAHDGT